VGRLVKDKGINELIAAFIELGKEFKHTTLLLVGGFEKELDPLLPETVSAIESNPKIISVGWQNDVRPFFAASDFLVFPSYREGFPNAVLQATAMGLPSIVSDINGCNEIVQEGINGLIVPPKNQQALYNAMMSFLKKDKVIAYDSGKIRSQTEKNYKRKVIWEKLLEEYNSLDSE